jgi:hypothetical protein
MEFVLHRYSSITGSDYWRCTLPPNQYIAFSHEIKVYNKQIKRLLSGEASNSCYLNSDMGTKIYNAANNDVYATLWKPEDKAVKILQNEFFLKILPMQTHDFLLQMDDLYDFITKSWDIESDLTLGYKILPISYMLIMNRLSTSQNYPKTTKLY